MAAHARKHLILKERILGKVVGATGFEPATLRSRTRFLPFPVQSTPSRPNKHQVSSAYNVPEIGRVFIGIVRNLSDNPITLRILLVLKLRCFLATFRLAGSELRHVATYFLHGIDQVFVARDVVAFEDRS